MFKNMVILSIVQNSQECHIVTIKNSGAKGILKLELQMI